MDYIATEPEDIGQDVVILTEADQELQLNLHAEQVEREVQSALESFPFFSSPFTEENLFDKSTTATLDTTESLINPTSRLDLLPPLAQTASSTEVSSASQHPTTVMSTFNSTEMYDFLPNTSLLHSDYNETDYHLNVTFHPSQPESTMFPEPSYEPHTQNQTVPDATLKDHTEPSEMLKEYLEIQETNLDLNISQANYSETDSNHTQEENILDTTSKTSMTSDNLIKVTLGESAVEDPVELSFPTKSPREEEELRTQTTHSPDANLTSWWLPLDGSGDISQGEN